ncbi:hypothetical protein CJP74_03790 [Psittacicella melopsittaci]|uniref:Translocation and assembly module subunit TamA n=1 Tax=Psittacicella melopsittaci TaxID=2028576 RepID=A0A3A1Y9E8_9GAMM|nr:BamA/TamA family outer membrane protein [Psittacicella melopsittaci]RIY32737.1 hypothetical protein CJP74_03790 [Psittacicella melopsittaci]
MKFFRINSAKPWLTLAGALVSLPSLAEDYVVERDGLIITYSEQGTKFTAASSNLPAPVLNNGFNAVTALSLYISQNDIRHIGLTDYPQTYKFVNQVFDALKACQVNYQTDSEVNANSSRGVRNLTYAQVQEVEQQASQGNYNNLYQALNLLGNTLDVPQLSSYVNQPCVIKQLSQGEPIDYVAFNAEQQKAPNVLQVLRAYYRSLFANYYTPAPQKQQTPPLIFTNKGSQAVNEHEFSNKSLLNSQNSFSIETGDFTTQVYGFGSQAEQAALANNLYAQVGENVANAIRTITQVNADGSLRHLFTVNKLVTSAVQAYGFYNANVEVQPEGEKKFVVRVTLGEPVRLTDASQIIIRGQGSGLSTLYTIAQKITPAGSVFKSSDYTQVKDDLLAAAQDAGYLDAQYKVSQVLVNREANIARWNLDLETGTRYHINSINIIGGPLDPRLTYYMTNLSVGEDYSEEKVSRSIAYLQASRNFDTVDLSSQVNRENRSVDLTYTLTNGKPNSLEWSNGYDTTEGLRTSVYYDRYYVNRWGGSIGSNAYLSRLTQRFETYYRHPYLYSPLTKYFTFGFYVERAYQTRLLYYSRSAVAYMNYVRVPFQNWSFTGTLYLRKDLWQELGYNRNQGLAYSEFIFARSGTTTDLSLTLRTTFGLGRLLSGGVSYNAYILKARHTFTLTEKNDLVVGLRLGRIDSNRFRDIAPSLRFYSGGMNSIRGYGYQSISSYKGDADIGANKQMEVTLEFLHSLGNNLKAAVFVDGGDSSDTVSIKNMKDWYYGAGVGVRYYLPVGYASFDIAYPLEPGFQWSKIAFYININASF